MGQLKRQLLTWGAIIATTAVLPGLALADSVSPDHNGGRHGGGDHSRGDHSRGDHSRGGHRWGERQDDAKLSVAGRAVSRGTTDSYGLQIRGRSGDQPTDAGGMVRFAHKGDNVMEGLVGEITCLSKDSAGVVSLTGTITRSGKRDGKGDKDKGGKDKDDRKAPGMPGSPEAPEVSFAPTAAEDDGTGLLDELASWDAGDDSGGAEPAKHGRDGKGERGERGRRGGGELAGKDFAFTIATAGEPQKFSKPTIGDKGTLAACSSGGESVDVTRGGFKVREAGADEAKGDEHGKDKEPGEDRGDRKGRRGWWRR